MPSQEPNTPTSLGRYTLHDEIASGGMATVYMGRASGDAGFSRVVAIKRMLPKLAGDPQFVAMFLDEARLASRIRHPNVVPILDVVAEQSGFFIVMDYVRGQSLYALLRAAAQRSLPVPVDVAAAVMTGVLAGLHAAHEARDKDGHLLDIVHRDVSPHNILVGVDGVARIMDFGIAKASRQLHVTQAGQIKGKLSYMAPEQLRGEHVDRRVDIFVAGVVLWGMLAGRRLFVGSEMEDTMRQVLGGEIPKLALLRPDVPPALDAVLAIALERDRARRFPTARDFSRALETACPRVAGPSAIGEWVEGLAGDVLAERDRAAARAEVATEPRPEGDRPPADAPTVRMLGVRALPDAGSDPEGSAAAEEQVSEVQTLELRPPHDEPPAARISSVSPPLDASASATTVPGSERTTAESTTGVERSPGDAPERRPAWGVLLAVAALTMIVTIAIGARILVGHRPPPRRDTQLELPAAALLPSPSPSPSPSAASAPDIPASEVPAASDGGAEAPSAQPSARPAARPSTKPSAKPTTSSLRKAPPVDTPLLPEQP